MQLYEKLQVVSYIDEWGDNMKLVRLRVLDFYCTFALEVFSGCMKRFYKDVWIG